MTASYGIEFGWRAPDFPTDHSRGRAFIEQIEETAAAAQECGFAGGWVADHFLPWAEWQDAATGTVECLTTLAYLAGRYPALTWGTVVICQSYRNPALLAKMVANLCAFAPGRIVFGIGAGWKDDEYRAYGYDFPGGAERVGQLDEAVRIARLLWTSDEPATFEGRYYSVREALALPRPDPLPPIMIGGGGERLLLRVVAEHADWYNLPGNSLEVYRRKLEALERHCREIGRDPDSIRKTWSGECVAVAGSRAEARRLAEASPFYEPENAIFGTPDDVAAALQTWVDAGVSYFQLRFADFPRLEGLRLFAREVMLRFAAPK